MLLLISACSSSSTSESTGEYLDSLAVTAKVKGRLVDMLGAKAAMSIKVKTYKDHVQLSGFVNNQTIKQRAGIIADNTLGVADVCNNLIVK
jgi:osmotically-inducible protein OsmY